MPFRLAYLGVTGALGLLPVSDRDKDAESLALRHQIVVLQRQLHGEEIRFTRADRALLAGLLRTACSAMCCAASGYWYARRPCCAGTGTWSPAGTRGAPGL